MEPNNFPLYALYLDVVSLSLNCESYSENIVSDIIS